MIQKNMVFEYQDTNYTKYFIPKKFINDFWYGLVLDSEFNIIDYDSWIEEDLNNPECFKLAEKTLDTAYIDTILQDKHNFFYQVNARIGTLFYLSNSYVDIENIKTDNRAYRNYTLQELKDMGFTVYQEKEEITELTLDQIAEKFGKDVKNIKIKK